MNAPDEVDPTTRERMRRVADEWRTLEPTPAEVAAARARFVARTPRRRGARVMPGTVALAIVLAGSVAFAGARVVWRHAVASGPAVVQTPDPGGSARIRPAGRPALPGAAVEPVPSVEVGPAAIDVNDLPPAPLSPPSSRPSPQPGAVVAPNGWNEAAEAMRSGNYPRAERAFDELVRTGNERTRDEARLARAQVWIAQGRTTEARPELVGLAATGATPLVRKQAAEALRSMP